MNLSGGRRSRCGYRLAGVSGSVGGVGLGCSISPGRSLGRDKSSSALEGSYS